MTGAKRTAWLLGRERSRPPRRRGRRAQAAEVRAEGGLELTITGFAGMLAHGGDLAQQREDPDLGDGLDFSNDTEVHVLARARDGELGLDYGATIEFEADTDEVVNTDETWLFVRGGWGELRLGDVDGPVDASALGAYTIAAGTGGIDGDVVDALAVDAILPLTTDSGDQGPLLHPVDWAACSSAVSYTPNGRRSRQLGGDHRRRRLTHWVEAAAVYEAEFERFDFAASLVGGVAEVKDRRARRRSTCGPGMPERPLESERGRARRRHRRWRTPAVSGAATSMPASGAGSSPVYTSLTHGRVLGTSGYDGVGEPWNLVLSADLELARGPDAGGRRRLLRQRPRPRRAKAETGGDRGWVWVARLELAF